MTGLVQMFLDQSKHTLNPYCTYKSNAIMTAATQIYASWLPPYLVHYLTPVPESSFKGCAFSVMARTTSVEGQGKVAFTPYNRNPATEGASPGIISSPSVRAPTLCESSQTSSYSQFLRCRGMCDPSQITAKFHGSHATHPLPHHLATEIWSLHTRLVGFCLITKQVPYCRG